MLEILWESHLVIVTTTPLVVVVDRDKFASISTSEFSLLILYLMTKIESAFQLLLSKFIDSGHILP